jgi:hypothetical protein
MNNNLLHGFYGAMIGGGLGGIVSGGRPGGVFAGMAGGGLAGYQAGKHFSRPEYWLHPREVMSADEMPGFVPPRGMLPKDLAGMDESQVQKIRQQEQKQYQEYFSDYMAKPENAKRYELYKSRVFGEYKPNNPNQPDMRTAAKLALEGVRSKNGQDPRQNQPGFWQQMYGYLPFTSHPEPTSARKEFDIAIRKRQDVLDGTLDPTIVGGQYLSPQGKQDIQKQWRDFAAASGDQSLMNRNPLDPTAGASTSPEEYQRYIDAKQQFWSHVMQKNPNVAWKLADRSNLTRETADIESSAAKNIALNIALETAMVPLLMGSGGLGLAAGGLRLAGRQALKAGAKNIGQKMLTAGATKIPGAFTPIGYAARLGAGKSVWPAFDLLDTGVSSAVKGGLDALPFVGGNDVSNFRNVANQIPNVISSVAQGQASPEWFNYKDFLVRSNLLPNYEAPYIADLGLTPDQTNTIIGSYNSKAQGDQKITAEKWAELPMAAKLNVVAHHGNPEMIEDVENALDIAKRYDEVYFQRHINHDPEFAQKIQNQVSMYADEARHGRLARAWDVFKWPIYFSAGYNAPGPINNVLSKAPGVVGKHVLPYASHMGKSHLLWNEALPMMSPAFANEFQVIGPAVKNLFRTKKNE